MRTYRVVVTYVQPLGTVAVAAQDADDALLQARQLAWARLEDTPRGEGAGFLRAVVEEIPDEGV